MKEKRFYPQIIDLSKAVFKDRFRYIPHGPKC